MARIPRYVFPEYAIFHVTARGAGRIAIYREDDDRRAFLALFAQAVGTFGWSCHAFCLMTNHYHLVIECFRQGLSDGMQRLNGIYAQSFNEKYTLGPPLRRAVLVQTRRRGRSGRHLRIRPRESGPCRPLRRDRRLAMECQPLRRRRPLDRDLREHKQEKGDADHAVHREERCVEPAEVVRPDERVLVRKQQRDHPDPEPVRPAKIEPDPGRGKQRDCQQMEETRPPESAPNSEPNCDRVQALLAVDIAVEQRVEEVEPGDPERDSRPKRPGLPGQLAGHRYPGTHRREPVHRTEPEVAEPGEPLQVRVDDETGERDRPQPPHQRIQLEARSEVERKSKGAERRDLSLREAPRGKLATRRAWVPRVDLRIDQPVDAHRQRTCANHRERDPEEIVSG